MMSLKKDAAASFASLPVETRIKRDTIQIIAIILIVAALIAAPLLLKGRFHLRRGIEGTTQTPKLIFRQVAVFDGKTPEGARFAEQHYKSSDCANISRTVVFFDSQDRALSEVQAEAKRASKIVDLKPVLKDAHQQPIGERVVMEFVAPEGVSYAKIAWNQGAEYTSIIAPAFHYIEDFEKAAESPNNKEFFPGIDSAKTITFESTARSEGSTPEGTRYKEQQFRSSDCETIVARVEYFKTTELAQDQLQRKLAEATGVLEQGAKINSAGQQVGPRAVATFKAEPTSGHLEETVVMWVDGNVLHSITGLYSYVLEFEKRNDNK